MVATRRAAAARRLSGLPLLVLAAAAGAIWRAQPGTAGASVGPARGLSAPAAPVRQPSLLAWRNSEEAVSPSRRQLLTSSAAAAVGAAAAPRAQAAGPEKRRNLPAQEVARIVKEDLVQRQFLATADFSPEIYADSCTFQDEIDTYTYEKFIKGTKALFVGSESQVKLVGDVEVLDSGRKIRFKFDETLAFNFPLVHPKVTLTGVCTLTRGDDGLITSYREKWDQSVPEVLATTQL